MGSKESMFLFDKEQINRRLIDFAQCRRLPGASKNTAEGEPHGKVQTKQAKLHLTSRRFAADETCSFSHDPLKKRLSVLLTGAIEVSECRNICRCSYNESVQLTLKI